MKYRKKPIVIEAIQWNGHNLEEVKEFVNDGSLEYDIIDTAWKVGKAAPQIIMKIHTLEGDMNVKVGDYIIKGVEEEFYNCNPEIFYRTYEKVED